MLKILPLPGRAEELRHEKKNRRPEIGEKGGEAQQCLKEREKKNNLFLTTAFNLEELAVETTEWSNNPQAYGYVPLSHAFLEVPFCRQRQAARGKGGGRLFPARAIYCLSRTVAISSLSPDRSHGQFRHGTSFNIWLTPQSRHPLSGPRPSSPSPLLVSRIAWASSTNRLSPLRQDPVFFFPFLLLFSTSLVLYAVSIFPVPPFALIPPLDLHRVGFFFFLPAHLVYTQPRPRPDAPFWPTGFPAARLLYTAGLLLA